MDIVYAHINVLATPDEEHPFLKMEIDGGECSSEYTFYSQNKKRMEELQAIMSAVRAESYKDLNGKYVLALVSHFGDILAIAPESETCVIPMK